MGGWEWFCDNVPNNTLCYDFELARVGFMSQGDTSSFVDYLCACGLIWERDGQAADMAVVNQVEERPFLATPWLELMRVPWKDFGGTVLIGWLYEGERLMKGAYRTEDPMMLMTPPGWEFEGSISQQATFRPDGTVA